MPRQYRTVNGSFSQDVGSGQILENIRIRAGGSNVSIVCQDGGTVRNVAIENASNHPAPIKAHCRNGGNAVLSNVYISGVNDNCVFVNNVHSGHLTVSNCTFKDAVEDALYGSPPGNPTYRSRKASNGPGGGGTIAVESSFAQNCRDYGWRLGSSGSYVRNSSAINCGTALANLYGNGKGVTFRNVDVTSPNIGIKHIDHDRGNVGNWPEQVHTILDNVRVKASTTIKKFTTGAGPGTITGSPQGSPRSTVPPGAPTSAEQAAGGTSTATPQNAIDLNHTIEIRGGTTGAQFTISVTVGIREESGPTTSASSGSTPTVIADGGTVTDPALTTDPTTTDGSAPIGDCEFVEYSDPVSARPGGGGPGGGGVVPSLPTTLSGSVGPGETAYYSFAGDITGFDITPEEGPTVLVDDKRVDPSQYGSETGDPIDSPDDAQF